MHYLPKAMQYRQAPWATFWAIFTKLCMGRVSQVRSLTPNFRIVAFKMSAYRRQNSQNCYFWYNFTKKGYTPLSDFYQIWLWEEVPGPHPPVKFHRCGFKKIWVYSPPNRQNWYFFGINFPKMGILPYAIFTKFGLGKGVPDPYPHAKFYRCGFKNVGL